MSSDPWIPGGSTHPVAACADLVTEALDGLADVPVELLSPTEKAAALVRWARIADQAKAVQLRLLAVSDDVAADEGARDAGAWLAHHTRSDRGARRRDLRLSEALAQRWTRLSTALAHGQVNLEQTHVVARALDTLPDEISAELLVQAEEHLIELAANFPPDQLRVLGRKILDVIAPEIGEAHEARALEAEEQRAQEDLALTFNPAGNGCTRISILVPDAVAFRLRTYLESFTSPRHDAMTGGEGDRIPTHRQRGQAFCALLEAIDPRRMPLHGGDATTVFVTMTLDALRTELATAGLLGAEDDRITAADARRLACNATLIPVVLGGKSEVLDLGRGARLFSPAQRKALRIRDQRCRAEGCTVPAPWCDAHHRKQWLLDGPTDLANGVLLCNFHHHRAHDQRYLVEDLPNGDVRYTRRN